MTLDNCCDSHIKVLDEISEGQAKEPKKLKINPSKRSVVELFQLDQVGSSSFVILQKTQ
jgi:hypothetical protein